MADTEKRTIHTLYDERKSEHKMTGAEGLQQALPILVAAEYISEQIRKSMLEAIIGIVKAIQNAAERPK